MRLCPWMDGIPQGAREGGVANVQEVRYAAIALPETACIFTIRDMNCSPSPATLVHSGTPRGDAEKGHWPNLQYYSMISMLLLHGFFVKEK